MARLLLLVVLILAAFDGSASRYPARAVPERAVARGVL